jgi:hypothetical protein
MLRALARAPLASALAISDAQGPVKLPTRNLNEDPWALRRFCFKSVRIAAPSFDEYERLHGCDRPSLTNARHSHS